MAAIASDVERRLQAAIADVKQNRFPDYQAAANAWQVPASTLRHRVNGRTPRQLVHQASSRLTED